jgi:hypothetical protein
MQNFTYGIKKSCVENKDSETSFSEVSELKSEKAVTSYKKLC